MSDNVVNINKKNTQKVSKPSMGQIYQQIVAVMLGEGSKRMPPFKPKFHILTNGPGNYELLQEDLETEIVVRTTEKALIHEVALYTSALNNEDLAFEPKHNKAIAELWLQKVPRLAKPPAMLRYKDEPGLCWHRLPFEPQTGDIALVSPIFADFIDRCFPNADAVMAFIGSVFVGDAMNQQYLWLEGGGKDGKSSVTKLLLQILGPLATSIGDYRANDSFITAKFVGKRFAVFADIDDPRICQRQFFKGLTGGEPISINQKFREEYETKLSCRAIFTSNYPPTLGSSRADERRAIVVRMTPFTGQEMDMATYDRLLATEAPFIVGNCIEKYHELCPNHGRIPADMDRFEEVAAVNEAHFENFVLSELEPCSAGEGFVTVAKLKELYESKSRGAAPSYSSFIRFFERTYLAKQAPKWSPLLKKTVRAYLGWKVRAVYVNERYLFKD